MKFAIARRRGLLGGVVAILVAVAMFALPTMAFAGEVSGESFDATPGLASFASVVDEIDGGHAVADETASVGAGGAESSDVEESENLDNEAAGAVGDVDGAADSGTASWASNAGDADANEGDTEADETNADGSDDAAASGEDAPSCHPEQASEDASSCHPEQSGEDASSCHPEQSGEDASSCHPEQASEASASKDLDATAQAEAGATAQAAASEVAEDDAAAATEYVNMYRLYNPNSGEHFYTSSLDEAASVTEAGWRYEGVGWVAPKSSAVPVYRLYNPNAGDHHYTQSLEERNTLISLGWNDEGIGWYSDDSGSGIEVLRQYNPNAVAGAHNFTASSDENENLVSVGWSAEGIAWYASSQATQSIAGRWIVTSAWGSLERYWLDSTATIATSRLVDPTTELDSGAGWYAYAKSDGAVVRGAYDSGAGYVYLADEDGRLVSDTDDHWLVTSVYAGSLQRYYLVTVDGIVVAKTGHFTVDGNNYYGLADMGYVARNYTGWFGRVYGTCDNEGMITEHAPTDYWDGLLYQYLDDANVNQMLFVKYTGGSNATVCYYLKNGNGEWVLDFTCQGYVGRNGIDKVREGDGKTPTGVFTPTKAFGLLDDPGAPMGYQKVNSYNYWCGDSSWYNQFIDTRVQQHSCSGEHLINYSGYYDYCIDIGYNAECTYGKGSALFLHCIKPGHYSTAGCVAISTDMMYRVITTMTSTAKIAIRSL